MIYKYIETVRKNNTVFRMIGITIAFLFLVGSASAVSVSNAYVANYGSDNVSVIDKETNTVIGSINVEGF